MTEFATLGNNTGFTPGDVAVWNETQSGIALFNDLGQFDDLYGVWDAQGAVVPGDGGGGSTGPASRKKTAENPTPRGYILPSGINPQTQQDNDILAITALLALYFEYE